MFDLKTNKAVIARNVKVAEGKVWNWEAELVEETWHEIQAEREELNDSDEIEDEPVRGTRLLSDIYN